MQAQLADLEARGSLLPIKDFTKCIDKEIVTAQGCLSPGGTISMSTYVG